MSNDDISRPLRLGTRGSLLARTQSEQIARELERGHLGLRVELQIFKTSGDRITDQPLHEFGGKGLFTKELEQGLIAGEVDFVVHSYKDVPVTMPLVDNRTLVIAATPRRQDSRDVLITAGGGKLSALRAGARVGTGSLRRRCQLLAIRPDLVIEPLRGNVDTRLRKLRAGEYDGIVLAAAGLIRTGLFSSATMHPLDELIGAPGQGALALQCRREDAATTRLLNSLNNPGAETCVAAERAVVQGLNGDCHSPIAAHATLDGDHFRIVARVGGRDGTPPVIEAACEGAAGDVKLLVEQLLKELFSRGAVAMLNGKPTKPGRDMDPSA